MKIQSYEDLLAWQQAMVLVEGIYKVTHGFPTSEKYGLCSQMRRSAVSIASNIAEGKGRVGTREFLRHLSIAYGSLCELETQVKIAHRLEYGVGSQYAQLLQQAKIVGKLINGLSRSLLKAQQH